MKIDCWTLMIITWGSWGISYSNCWSKGPLP